LGFIGLLQLDWPLRFFSHARIREKSISRGPPLKPHAIELKNLNVEKTGYDPVADLNKLKKFEDDSYRLSYLDTHVRGSIAYQIQDLRDKLGLNQTEFGKLVGMPQSVISRLEDMDHSGSITTLLRIANCLKIGLQVRYCDFETILDEDVARAGSAIENINETLARRLKEAMHAPKHSLYSTISINIEGTHSWQMIQPQSPRPILEFPASGTRNLETYIPTSPLPVWGLSI
jgi:putative transcriptional regulator